MKPVAVPAHAFVFCRYSIAGLIWLAWGLHSVGVLAVAGVLLAWSALAKVGRAPLILLYTHTLLHLRSSPEEVLDETAMRFAHTMGTALAGACLGAIALSPRIGWRLTVLFALLKTISALGFCPASKLFTCATNTTCCPLTKRALGVCPPKDQGTAPQ